MMKFKQVAFLTWLVLITPAIAKIEITDAWCKAPGPNGVIFMEITGDADDFIETASSGVAKKVELHTHIKKGNIYQMRRIKTIPVPAKLRPGGLHIMLIGLQQRLQPGDMIPLKIQFAKAGEVLLDVAVKPIDYDPTKLACGCDK